MTRLFANRAVVVLITIAAMLLAAILLSFFPVFFFGGSQSSAYSHITRQRNTSNITRQQYSNALAKWNNLHVTDYEATIQVSNLGKWKIVVHVDSAYGKTFVPEVQASYSHRIVDLESLDSESTNTKLYAHSYEFVAIGGLFDNVNDELYCQENSCEGRDFFWPSRYVIEFDPTMGYPSSITSTNEYTTVETRIENVKILK
jgi:hypothetical protein